MCVISPPANDNASCSISSTIAQSPPNVTVSTTPKPPGQKRRRRAPSPSRWIPGTLQSFNLHSEDLIVLQRYLFLPFIGIYLGKNGIHVILPERPDVCLLFNDSMTPIFSFLLFRLIFEASSGAQDVSTINQFGGLVLGIAALDASGWGIPRPQMLYYGILRYVLDNQPSLRRKILKQDKKWCIERYSPLMLYK